MIKVFRNDELLEDNLEVESLKIHSKETSEIKEGSEWGIKLKDFDDYKDGDVIRFYKEMQKEKQFNYSTGHIEI